MSQRAKLIAAFLTMVVLTAVIGASPASSRCCNANQVTELVADVATASDQQRGRRQRSREPAGRVCR
jgi:hypothetical protein